MFVFPPSTPKLHAVEAAGQTIRVGAGAAVNVALPANSPVSQIVRLRSEGFTGNVAVKLVVVPEHSASTVFGLILSGSANVSQSVNLPVGEIIRIQARAP